MEYLKLLRIKHYVKNVLIFLPLIFGGLLMKENCLLQTFIGFLCFCFTASMIYIINDIRDKEKDKKHKTKSKRPIASGKISVRNAIISILLLLMFTTLIILLSKIPISAIFMLIFYFVMNLAYSFGLKNVPLVDILIIAFGFLIRVIYGAEILNIEVSNWLYLTVFSSSFYLALGKRRNEIVQNGTKTRNVLAYYNKEFLDKNMYMCLSMAIIFYSLWTTDNNIVEKNHNMLVWTVPIIMIICMRYSMQIEKSDQSDGDPTEVILNDKWLIGLILLLGFLLLYILYF